MLRPLAATSFLSAFTRVIIFWKKSNALQTNMQDNCCLYDNRTKSTFSSQLSRTERWVKNISHCNTTPRHSTRSATINFNEKLQELFISSRHILFNTYIIFVWHFKKKYKTRFVIKFVYKNLQNQKFYIQILCSDVDWERERESIRIAWKWWWNSNTWIRSGLRTNHKIVICYGFTFSCF